MLGHAAYFDDRSGLDADRHADVGIDAAIWSAGWICGRLFWWGNGGQHLCICADARLI